MFTNVDGKVPRLDPIIKEYEKNKNEELGKTKKLPTPMMKKNIHKIMKKGDQN